MRMTLKSRRPPAPPGSLIPILIACRTGPLESLLETRNSTRIRHHPIPREAEIAMHVVYLYQGFPGFRILPEPCVGFSGTSGVAAATLGRGWTRDSSVISSGL